MSCNKIRDESTHDTFFSYACFKCIIPQLFCCDNIFIFFIRAKVEDAFSILIHLYIFLNIWSFTRSLFIISFIDRWLVKIQASLRSGTRVWKTSLYWIVIWMVVIAQWIEFSVENTLAFGKYMKITLGGSLEYLSELFHWPLSIVDDHALKHAP